MESPKLNTYPANRQYEQKEEDCFDLLKKRLRGAALRTTLQKRGLLYGRSSPSEKSLAETSGVKAELRLVVDMGKTESVESPVGSWQSASFFGTVKKCELYGPKVAGSSKCDDAQVRQVQTSGSRIDWSHFSN